MYNFLWFQRTHYEESTSVNANCEVSYGEYGEEMPFMGRSDPNKI